jgi:glutamine amidotransferase
MITIIDYGVGNLASILNILKRINVDAEITSDKTKILGASKILLPGVGAFDAAVGKIEEYGLADVLNKKPLVDNTPILGNCLGMQLLTNESEEGKLKGFGWIDAKTIRFSFQPGQNLKVPHMGWNEVSPKRTSPLTSDFEPHARFYFVHSYHVVANDPGDVVMTTNYGYEFHSVVQHENIFGAQFHPEKSHKFGMKLLSNFNTL